MADPKKTGEKMQTLGCLLTLVVTIPLLLTVFLGPVGLIIGAVIAILVVIGHLVNKK